MTDADDAADTASEEGDDEAVKTSSYMAEESNDEHVWDSMQEIDSD
jgi:hypothetical protein